MEGMYFEQKGVYIKLHKLYKLTSISVGVLVVFQVSVVCITSAHAACPLFYYLNIWVVYKDNKICIYMQIYIYM